MPARRRRVDGCFSALIGMGGGVWLGGGMDVVDTLGSLVLGDPSAILRYWESELLQALYFRPKGVSLNCPYASLGVRKASSAERPASKRSGMCCMWLPGPVR